MSPSNVIDTTMQLPVAMVGPTDVRQVMRELARIDDFLSEESLRAPDKAVDLPTTSSLLEAFMTANKLNMAQTAERKTALQSLKTLVAKAPQLHISFATEPPPDFTAKLITWLRTNIHPAVLLNIGLEPTVAAGCIVRTANHQFDFSLRKRFVASRDLLMAALQGQQGRYS